ncbi:MAG TPA: sulfatase-like hydrolase/transferase [Fibrobacteraceae bacterium]|nr:sulfatase-like hydrolase/transferase [Fibrobacteraceae bacterium]
MKKTLQALSEKNRLDRWIALSALSFCLIRLISLVVHFLGPSPYGGPLTTEPERFLPQAIGWELSLILLFSAIYSWILNLGKFQGKWTRVPFLVLACIYLALTQFDQEIERWLGEHITVTFIRNYFHETEGNLLTNLLKSDWLFTGIAVLEMLIPIGFSFWLYRRRWTGRVSSLRSWIFVSIPIVGLLASNLINPSQKRTRRVCPVVVSLSHDLIREWAGVETPKDSQRAQKDLISFVSTGHFADALDSAPTDFGDSVYPLLHHTGPGRIPAEEWKQLPLAQRPNIVLVVMESWRVSNTSLAEGPEHPTDSPILDSLIRASAYYFPYVHSLGFPSVEGAVGIHLGMWPHHRSIVISQYASINTRSLPELLRDLGYHSEIFLGFDPSFSNMLPWYRRWYDRTVYEPKCEHDGPLMDSLFAHFRHLSADTVPFLLTTWTNTTHPPYVVPKESGMIPAKETDDRFSQALRYSSAHIAAFIDSLQHSPTWDRTIIILVGDHSQPVIPVRQNPNIAGALSPGHTWIPLAILGGWSGVPAPRRNDEVVPQMDLPPTVLQMLDVSIPNHFMGHSLLSPVEQPFLCFRFGESVLIRPGSRVNFMVGDDHGTRYETILGSNRDYGLLPHHLGKVTDIGRDSLDFRRLADMIFLYAQILDRDRLYPPASRKMSPYEHRQ